MDFNNPFKDLDKKLFKESNSKVNDKNSKKNNSSSKNTKSSTNSNYYNPNSKAKTNDAFSNLSNKDDNIDINPSISDEELFLTSMQSSIKTDFLFNAQNKYFQKDIDNTREKKKKEKKIQKDTIKENTIEYSIKESNINNNQKCQISTLSEIINLDNTKKKLNKTLNQDFEQKPALKNKKADFNIKKPAFKQENPPINNLNSEEDDFFEAMSGVKLLNNNNIFIPEVEEFIVQNDQSSMIFDYEDGKKEFALNYNDDYVQCNIIGLDIAILAQLQNRHYNPEAHIDLHGLNSRQAFDSLIPFFKNAYYKDMRSLLIVTGKGTNSLEGRAILRSKVCDWLIQDPFKHLVLAFCTAQIQDGGSGALYILLRKRKKNAKDIAWDRLPNDYDLWANLDR